MMDSDLSGYSKIEETISDTLANSFLTIGWKLITVVPYEYSEWDIPKGAMYVLGWPSEQGEPKEPPSRYKNLD